ncbi:hypothetical protein F4823DRAFT_619515 [Ustulina deusta]|nr:hypothetical protein F4823DRAFT_619515 [Ustulina deusta]
MFLFINIINFFILFFSFLAACPPRPIRHETNISLCSNHVHHEKWNARYVPSALYVGISRTIYLSAKPFEHEV